MVRFSPDGCAYFADYGAVRDNGCDTHFVSTGNGPLVQIPEPGVIFKICRTPQRTRMVDRGGSNARSPTEIQWLTHAGRCRAQTEQGHLRDLRRFIYADAPTVKEPIARAWGG